MRFIKRFLPNSSVERKYVQAGGIVGDAVSYSYMGECVGFEGLLKKWADWEKEYARRGFRTVSLDRFVELGGYGKSVDDVLGQKRENGEDPIFHAQIYSDEFLGKIKPVIDFKKISEGEVQQGTYDVPSTKKKNN